MVQSNLDKSRGLVAVIPVQGPTAARRGAALSMPRAVQPIRCPAAAPYATKFLSGQPQPAPAPGHSSTPGTEAMLAEAATEYPWLRGQAWRKPEVIAFGQELAAIHDDGGTCDIACFVRGQEQEGVGDITHGT